MAQYYTTNDLLVRRVGMATWICNKVMKITNSYKYGELVSKGELSNYEYIVACLEAVECYTPITLATEDGETNCLTEAKLNSIFDNVETVTKLAWQPIGTTYNPYNWVLPGGVELSNNIGTTTLNDGTTLLENDTQIL